MATPATIFLNHVVLHVPTVSIAVSSNTTIAGKNYTLTCSVMATPDDITTLTWSGPGVDQNSVQVSSSSSSALMLTFNPLHTSHGGAYTCEASLNVSQVDTSDLTSIITENVIVQSKLILSCVAWCYVLIFLCSKFHLQ